MGFALSKLRLGRANKFALLSACIAFELRCGLSLFVSRLHSPLCALIPRIDLLVETAQFIYLMELKLDKTAAEAMQQIDSKEYTLQYEMGQKKLFKIGINFNTQQCNVDDWKVES